MPSEYADDRTIALGETKALWLIANDMMTADPLRGVYNLAQTGVLLAFDYGLPEGITGKLQELMAAISKEMSKDGLR